MNEEQLRAAMMNAAPKPSVERRLEWLEADGAAQRTAILKLEQALRWHRVALWVLASYLLASYLAALALAVLT